jgi:uncharacterized RDD family membrane protein YckC
MADTEPEISRGRNSQRAAPRGRSLPRLLVRSGARTAEQVARATRIDDAIDAVAEEAIVRAVESEAVERALDRILAGPLVEDAVERAVSSPNVEHALREALDSEMVDRLWEQLLKSDEVQQLFERIGEAPELRAAIAAQGAGLLHDVGAGARGLARRTDELVEAVVRRLLSRARRRQPSSHAGLASRALAFALDASIINVCFLALSGLVTFLISALTDSGKASTGVLVAGAGLWLAAGGLYLVCFWALAGQTPGMRFVGIALDSRDGRRIGVRRATRRLLGLLAAVVPLGIGLLAVATDAERRGWQDRIAQTDVAYADEDAWLE